MKKACIWIVLLAAGCAPKYREPLPDPLPVPPVAPKAVLRLPVEFTFKDFETGKEYFFRRYTADDPSLAVRDDRLGGDKTSIATLHEAGEQRLEIVTVVEPGTTDERLATDAERAYALGVLQEDWIKRGNAEMMTYHLDAVDRARRMRADLIDERIHYTARVIEDLKEERFRLHADQESIKATGYKTPEGHLAFLEQQIARRDALILWKTAEHEMLKYQKSLRDAEIKRSSAPLRIREWLPVKDLVDGGMAPERVISEVTSNVRSDTWKHPNSLIRYTSGYLELGNSRAVIDQVRDYLAALRQRKAEGR